MAISPGQSEKLTRRKTPMNDERGIAREMGRLLLPAPRILEVEMYIKYWPMNNGFDTSLGYVET